MGPHGYAACNFHSDAADAGKKLHDVPQPQEDYRRHGQREDEHKREYARPRIEQHIGAHHSGYGSAGPNCGDAGVEVKNDVKQTRSNPADKIKEEIREVPEEVLDVVAEDPEKKHVATEVKPVGVEKHARYQRQEGDFEADVSCKERRDPGGNRGVGEQQWLKGRGRERRLQADGVDKGSDVGKDQRDVDEGISA